MTSPHTEAAARRDDWTRRPHRKIWALALPIMLANVSIPLVGAVDTAVMGHLPSEVYIGAVAIGAVIFSFLYWGFGFLRMGTTGFVSQAFGARDHDEMANAFCRAVAVGVATGLLLILLHWPIGRLALWLFEAEAETESLAWLYFSIRIWSAPAALVQYAALGFLIGVQRTPAVLGLQLLLNGTNITLDLVFVLGMGWGVEGVATASLIGEYTAAIAGVLLVRGTLRRLGGRVETTRLLDPSAFKALVSVNFNIFVRTLCLVFAFAYFTAQGASFGTTTLAANAVLMQMIAFIAYGLDGFAHAVETLGGSAYGARDLRTFRVVVRTSTLWAAFMAFLNVAVFYLVGGIFIGWMTSLDAVREEALQYLPWVALSPLLSVWSFQLDGIYIGTTFSREMRNGMLVSLAGYLAAVSLLTPWWGNHGLWCALLLFFVLRALTLYAWYPRIEARMAEMG
ncbi:MAG: MATE family efflux transporter [Gammaproteobacteria bacterium]|nr:MATE family efflux transporter [Gammaproteobacteria bacterium]